jgi:L-aminopeptidase/D-esterase-like protein
LNNITDFTIRPEDAVKAIDMCTSDPISEGNGGGGAAMMCHG